MNNWNLLIEKHYQKIFAALLMIYVILYLAFSFGTWIWTDEAYTFAIIKHSVTDIWKITAADVHPPLYYFLLKLFSVPFNYGMWSAKLFSILPFVFIIAFGGIEMGKLFNKKTGLIFMILFFCFPILMRYATEVRMYSLAAAFVFGNAIFAYKAYIDSQYKNWIGFVLFGVAAAYTHYFAFVSILLIYLLLLCAVLAKKKALWGKWIISVVLSSVMYLPWISSFVSQLAVKVHNEYWIGEINVHTIIEYAISVFGVGDFWLLSLVFALSYLIAFVFALAKKRYKNKSVCILCLSIPVGTILIGVVASILIRPVFVIRYIVPAVPLVVAFMAIILGDLSEIAIVSSVLTISIIVGMYQYEQLFFNEYRSENYVPSNKYASAECYVPIDDSCHMPQTLAYYVTDKPIYYGGTPNLANPWKNIYEAEAFNFKNVKEFIVLTASGKDVPEEYLKEFKCKELEPWTVQYKVNAYLLTKRE